MKKKNILFLILIILEAFVYLRRSPTAQVESRNNLLPSQNSASKAPPVDLKHISTQPIKPLATLDSDKNPEEPRQLSAKEVEELRSKTKNFIASLYSSQKAFYAEYNQYITDVIAIGISTDPVLPFKAGFLESSVELKEISSDANIDVRRLDTDSLVGERDGSINEPIKYAPFVRDIDLSAYKQFCKYRCTADSRNFEMLVAAPLGNGDQVDVWLVNDNKEIILVHDGTQSQME